MKKINLFILIAITVVSIFSSCKKEVEIMDQTINTSVTWDEDAYVIDGVISIVNGGVLTIAPGTKLKFGAGGRIEVGSVENSTLIAEGTEDEPIIFTSSHAAPTAGNWEGIVFYQNTQENTVMKYCEIEYAGASSYYNAAVAIVDCKITMQNCKVSHSAGYGVYAYECNGFTNPFMNNTIEDCVNHPFSMNLKYLKDLGAGNTYSPAANKGIEVGFESYSSTTNNTWIPQSVPYYVDYMYSIDGTLTISSGCIFKFGADDGFYFGSYENTTINADGVTFTSSADPATHGDWRGLEFFSYTQTANITNCTISSGGEGGDVNANVEIYGEGTTVNLDGCTISKSEGYGIYVDWNASYTGTVIFDDNTLGEVYTVTK